LIKDKKLYRILVVEDNIGDFSIVEEYLNDLILDPVITHAKNYKQTSVLLDTALPCFDAILLDLTLPDKGGKELIAEIIEIALTCPIIILTGYSDVEFSIHSISLGISDYLIKDDLNATTLYKSVIYAIERGKSAAHLKENIAAIEKQNEVLKEIAWIQSHKVRAPLARMMGIIELIKNKKDDLVLNENLLGHFMQSADELDSIIREIVAKSEILNVN
jgi:FixJ family two-component response regulator